MTDQENDEMMGRIEAGEETVEDLQILLASVCEFAVPCPWSSPEYDGEVGAHLVRRIMERHGI